MKHLFNFVPFIISFFLIVLDGKFCRRFVRFVIWENATVMLSDLLLTSADKGSRGAFIDK